MFLCASLTGDRCSAPSRYAPVTYCPDFDAPDCWVQVTL